MKMLQRIIRWLNVLFGGGSNRYRTNYVRKAIEVMKYNANLDGKNAKGYHLDRKQSEKMLNNKVRQSVLFYIQRLMKYASTDEREELSALFREIRINRKSKVWRDIKRHFWEGYESF